MTDGYPTPEQEEEIAAIENMPYVLRLHDQINFAHQELGRWAADYRRLEIDRNDWRKSYDLSDAQNKELRLVNSQVAQERDSLDTLVGMIRKLVNAKSEDVCIDINRLVVDQIAKTQEIHDLRQDVARVRLALKDVFLMMDESILVRNTDDDAKPDFALRMISIVQRLKDAHCAIEDCPAKTITER